MVKITTVTFVLNVVKSDLDWGFLEILCAKILHLHIACLMQGK